MIERIENHREIATNYLVQQYKESFNLRKIVETFVGRIQELENQAQSVYRNRWLETATGLTLDNIGSIAGEDRNWKKDEEYRASILVRIMMNSGGGTPEDLLNAIKSIYAPKVTRYRELRPLLFYIFLQSPNYPKGLHSLIHKISPLCIKDYIVTYSEAEQPFVLAESTSEGVPFLVSDSLLIEESYDVGDGEFEVEASVVKNIKEQIGLAEIILTTTNLKITGGIYQVNNVTELDVLPYEANTLDGYTIIQGNKLSEVLNHGR